jgi:agmatinase
VSDRKGWDNAFTADSPMGTVKGSPSYAGALSFMRRKYSRDLEGADVAVVGIPLDTATTNRPGARFGPRAIRAASTGISWERPWPWAFDPFDRLAVIDYGDCEFDYGRPETIVPFIEAYYGRILDAGVTPLTLGGDHFVTYPVLRAVAARHGPVSLVHFDAHSDTWSEDQQRLDHGTMFYHAAKEGLVDDARSVQIGLRTTNDDTLGFHILDARRVHRDGPEFVAAEARRVVGDNKVYLTFDIDCLDPACRPTRRWRSSAGWPASM